jgi:hypothetical protein
LTWTLPAGTVTALDTVDGVVPVSCQPDPITLGTTTVRCHADDLSGNRGHVRFRVTLLFPSLAQRANALLAATLQVGGATNLMQNVAKRLVTSIAEGFEKRICTNLSDYADAVEDAHRRRRITALERDGLLAIANEMIEMARCGR